MSRNRASAVVEFSQLFRHGFPILALTSWLAVGAYSQTTGRSPGSAPANNTCEGKQPSHASSPSGSADPQAGANSGDDKLKLSTKSTTESTDAEGQFCTRPDHKALKPSVKPAEPETTPGQEQPATSTPIAQVTDGRLTIRANGADFASVLESLGSATGLTIETPATISSEPVFLNIGPVPIVDGLVALLNGSNYNYIIVGSERDSQAVKRLILTERSTGGAGTLVASTQGSPPAAQPLLYGGVQEDAAAESEPPPPPPAPVQPTVVPSSVPTGINVQKLAAESGKTPGQILDELQKRQQQVLDDQAAQSQSAPQQ